MNVVKDKNIRAAFFLLISFVFFSCSDLANDAASVGSVIISIDKTFAQKLTSFSEKVQAQKYFIDVSVGGDYSAKKTAEISGQGAQISFSGIPVDASIYVQAELYKNPGEILYKGKSQPTIVKAGVTEIQLSLVKVAPGQTGGASESPGQSDSPQEPGQPDEPVIPDPEPVDISVHIYVSASADPGATDADGSEEKPFATIDAALNYIREKNDSDQAYTIDLSGTFNIASTLAISDDTESGGPIPAKTLALNGLEDAVIDRAAAASSGAGKTAMSVNSSVPVKITNLKITGGYGGGIIIAQGSTVALGDGVLITGNRNPSNGRGGAIHNEGTLFMYGSAIIGDKTNGGKSSEDDYTYPECSSTLTDFTKFANYASSGGGIFNGSYTDSSIQAKLYLGYSGYAADGTTPVKKDLTGGLYYNSGETGGALYNAGGSIVYFDSGTIAWNDSYSYGGAVYNDANASIYMSGGKILNNYAGHSSYTTAKGGGVANYKSSSKFIMSGGTINKNDTSGNGGGVWNGGKAYMYGSAVIGDSSAQAPANATLRGNKAESGGGVFNGNNSASGWSGDFYMGYKEDGSVDDSFSGGIYYNYANDGDTSNPYGGGGIVVLRETKIAGGTIAYNTSANRGGGIYKNYDSGGGLEISDCNIHDNAALVGGAVCLNANPNTTMTLSGSVLIPAGADKANDISLGGYGSSSTGATQIAKIKFASPLSSGFAALVTPNPYVQGRTPFVVVDGSGASLETECAKFSVRPQVEEGVTTKWVFDANGHLLPLKSSPNAVGDIVFKDGTALAYASGLALTAAQKADAVAVIFYAEGADTTAPLGQKTLGIGLKYVNKKWCLETAKGYKCGVDMSCSGGSTGGDYTEISKSSGYYDFTGLLDGSGAWQTLKNYLASAEGGGVDDTTTEGNYPAWEWANNYGTIQNFTGSLTNGWYLPTLAEGAMICTNYYTLNQALAAAGSNIKFESSTGYWWTCNCSANSSIPTVFYMLVSTGTRTGFDKNNSEKVCAIRAF